MNILLIGGSSQLMDQTIIKMKKEGHRVYLLTGEQYRKSEYEKVFERYNFTYNSDDLAEIFESVGPDVTIFFGAYDSNFLWLDEERESVRYISGLMNILVSYSTIKKGKFIYFSSSEVFEHNSKKDIKEDTNPSARSFRGMTLAQAERICDNYRENWNLDIITLRIDNLYAIPKKRSDATHIPGKMCLTALESNYILADKSASFSMIYILDAIQYIYEVVSCKKARHSLYHITSGQEVKEYELANLIRGLIGDQIRLSGIEKTGARCVLSGERFSDEFGSEIRNSWEEMVEKIALYMKKKKSLFVNELEEDLPWYKRALNRFGWMIKVSIPFLENMICFIPFFMLNNRVVGSEYFARLDFYLFYVLLFAIIYGQQQAIFSAVLAVSGYLFRQMYERSGFEVMLDYTTYVWVAQLFILGLVVGYMRDQIKSIKMESVEVQDHLNRQLGDIKDINNSNIRVKDVLEQQVINQKDSIGKIYDITSTLDQYTPEEVGFYAVEMIGKLLNSNDVAIYNVYNETYARMFSASSEKARELGNSIKYREMGEMYETLKDQRVFINRSLDSSYPLMANAIYERDEMKMIVMIWGIPWERMTLGQANILTVICYLIQNATLRANRYMDALEEERFRENSKILEEEAFSSLVHAFYTARKKNLTQCAVLKILVKSDCFDKTAKVLETKLRQTDYLGVMKDGCLYVLLANTNKKEAKIVQKRFEESGYHSQFVERLDV